MRSCAASCSRARHASSSPLARYAHHARSPLCSSLQWVLIKGGHLAAAEAADPTHPDDHHGEGPAAQPGTVTDILFDGKNMIELTERHIRWEALTWGVETCLWVAGGGGVPCLERGR